MTPTTAQIDRLGSSADPGRRHKGFHSQCLSSTCPNGTPVEYFPYEMKVAIPHWQGRVSPVFDVAGKVLVVEMRHGVEHARQDVVLDSEDPQRRVACLVRAETDVLICGAISWPLEMALSAAGIEVIPQTCGDVEQVLAAFAQGQLQENAFLMPGCCGRRRQFRARRRRGRR